MLAGVAAAEAEADFEVPDLDSAGAVCERARFPPPLPLALRLVARDPPWSTMGMSPICVIVTVAFAGIRSGGVAGNVSRSDETGVVKIGMATVVAAAAARLGHCRLPTTPPCARNHSRLPSHRPPPSPSPPSPVALVHLTQQCPPGLVIPLCSCLG